MPLLDLTLVSTRVTTQIQKFRQHPRSLLEFLRRNMYDDCDVLANLTRRMLFTKLLHPSYLSRVALLQILDAVANAVGVITKLLSAGSLVKISVVSVGGSAIRPKTVGGRQRRQNG
jgi:hypothetical protein